MSTQKTTLLVTLLVAVMGTCERLVTHFDMDCEVARVWGVNDELPERLR